MRIVRLGGVRRVQRKSRRDHAPFPSRGRNLLRVQGDLLAAHALGILNVFVVMGDPTAMEIIPSEGQLHLVLSGLIKLFKQDSKAGVDHSGRHRPATNFSSARR